MHWSLPQWNVQDLWTLVLLPWALSFMLSPIFCLYLYLNLTMPGSEVALPCPKLFFSVSNWWTNICSSPKALFNLEQVNSGGQKKLLPIPPTLTYNLSSLWIQHIFSSQLDGATRRLPTLLQPYLLSFSHELPTTRHTGSVLLFETICLSLLYLLSLFTSSEHLVWLRVLGTISNCRVNQHL